MRTYVVRVRRDPEDVRFWLASVDDLDTTEPSAKTLRQLHAHVREVIILAEDLADDVAFDVQWVYETGDVEADQAAAKLRADRARVEAEQEALAEQTRALARRLVLVRGMSLRDAAELLGVSPARVGQLTDAA